MAGMSSRSLPTQRHTIFQNSLMPALLDGLYDGEMTVAELLGHGNFGIGTFDALDGEMIIVDGQCLRLRGDGQAVHADLADRSPFAVVTNFVPDIVTDDQHGLTRAELSEVIDSLTVSENYMYAVRIRGRFSFVTTRAVTKQDKPYRPMTEAVEDDAHLRHENIEGTMVGFRTPIFEQGISVPGCHVHFADRDLTRGGHVLDFQVDRATVELCPGTDLQLRLPLTHDFSQANLAPDDLEAQIHAVEVKSPQP